MGLSKYAKPQASTIAVIVINVIGLVGLQIIAPLIDTATQSGGTFADAGTNQTMIKMVPTFFALFILGTSVGGAGLTGYRGVRRFRQSRG